jgi:hypothetical protein
MCTAYRLAVPVVLAALLSAGLAWADKGIIEGSVLDARNGVAVGVHPVALAQGNAPLGRTLTDRLGKFKFDFTYTPGQPLTVSTSSTTGYLGAQGVVEPNTEVVIKIMPRWATVLGILSDRQTGRGLADIPVRAGRGNQFVAESWATVKTDATGVYMMKVPAFEGDDLAQPIRDLWLSFNEGEGATVAHAQVRSAPVALWAWPDPTQPTHVDISLPAANATGLTLADVLTMKLPEALSAPVPVTPAAGAPAVPPTTSATGGAVPVVPAIPPAASAGATAPTTVQAIECVFICPHCGEKLRLTIAPEP